jgi:hypothetical protein
MTYYLIMGIASVAAWLSLVYFVTPVSILFTVFLGTCFVSIGYWEIVQPVLLRHISFRLFAKRDALRRMAIAGREDYRSKQYAEAEDFLCKIIAVIPQLNLMSFVCFVFQHKHANGGQDRCKQSVSFSPSVERLLGHASHDALLIMFINSPMLALFVAVGALIPWAIGKVNKLLITRKAEDFVYSLPLDLAEGELPTRLAA